MLIAEARKSFIHLVFFATGEAAKKKVVEAVSEGD